MAEPVPGELLLAILERVTAAHEAALDAVGVPPERLAQVHMVRACHFLARIEHPQARAVATARVQGELMPAVEAEAARLAAAKRGR